MARKARKLTAEQRAEIEADRVAAAEKTGAYSEVVVLEPTQEGLDLMARAIEEGKVARFREDDEDQITEKELDAIDEEAEEGDPSEDEIPAEEEPEEKGGVVKVKFKKRYAENAAAKGLTSKVAKRSNWDWLAQEIAKFCLDDKGKINIKAFVALLNVNGVDHSRWKSDTRGWEGRFRMTGRVALQKIVAERGGLLLPGDGDEPVLVPCEEGWASKYLPKA